MERKGHNALPIVTLQERYRKLGQESDKTKENRIVKKESKLRPQVPSPLPLLPFPLGATSSQPPALSHGGEGSGQLTRKGPCSVSSPSRELQPGPPLSQSTMGLFFGSFCDSTNLGKAQGRIGTSKRPRPARGR